MKVRIIKNTNLTLHTFVLYCLGFILLWEWLRPIQEVSPLASIPLLLLFSALVFLLSYVKITAFLSIPIYIVAILYVVHSVHFQGSIFDPQWFFQFWAHIVHLFQAMLTGQFHEISDVSRTFLFLLLFCLIGYLMRQWLVRRRNAFPFLFATVAYVAVIDTFTPYDASIAIIRIVIIGFILIGMLQVAKIQEKEGFYGRLRFPFTWISLVFVMIFLASFIGLAAPKSAPQWADPVPFLKGVANMDDEQPTTGSVKKMGYGENDEQLGGPFQLDTTPMFYADIETVHYWRAESKDYYTGKGWEASKGVIQPFTGNSATLYADRTALQEKEATIRMTGLQDFQFLFYEGHVTEVDLDNPFVNLFENTLTGKIQTENDVIEQYTLTYDYPTFSIEELKESDSFSYPAGVEQYYLQTPETLPERVSELARDITENYETAYEKAKAIESYFIGNGYTYETKRVAVPGPDDDYVDQFLFETKMGYCDNFSSSMVVMLRSVGIPARWVKGFTDGEFEEMLSEGKRRHLITNENAHSWVEAYFPGSGWVPFEPTRGFTNPFEFVDSFEEDKEETNPEIEQKEQEEQLELEEKEDEAASSSDVKKVKTTSIIAIVTLLLLVGIIIFKNYRQLAKRWVAIRLAKKPIASNFEEWYTRLLWLLKLNGFKRSPGETLREFANHIDKKLEGNSMFRLTKAYEERLYSNKDKLNDVDRLNEDWQTIVNKLPY